MLMEFLHNNRTLTKTSAMFQVGRNESVWLPEMEEQEETELCLENA